MKNTLYLAFFLIALILGPHPLVQGQFNFMYQHGANDDHTSVVSTIGRVGYVQAGSTFNGTSWDIHLMKVNGGGLPFLDVTFSTPNDEHATHLVQGNNNTYIICGYEDMGTLDLGFVMSVDTNFNLINKVHINATSNNKHTPALNVMNSAFYLQPNNNQYFPGDTFGGYLITGFEAVGYNPTDSKSGYAIKVDNNLNIQWVKKFDSPISAGQPDWDMCNSASWYWSGAKGYFISGSGTTPGLEQCALAALLNTNGNTIWKELYTDNAGAGSHCVAADCAYDDAELELYHLTNYSSMQCGGVTAFNEFTGAINPARTRYLSTGYSQNHYAYEFGATCAGNEILIAGYGHNQTHGAISGTFPWILRYDKNIAQINIWGAHYEHKIQSLNYNPNTTIFDIYQSAVQPRIFYPKLYAQNGTNDIVLGAFEDDLSFSENKLIKTDFGGKDSCGYFNPLFNPIAVNSVILPVNAVSHTYNLTPSSSLQNPYVAVPIPCQICTVNPNFTYTNSGCTYTFTATAPSNLCAIWNIFDNSNNIIFSSASTSFTYNFTLNGTYTICFADCAVGTNGVVCRDESCQTITVNCPPPCGILNADFAFTVNGCCVVFSDNTPDGNPNGCESWTFGTITSILQGDNISFCFPGSGTYNVCHNDCCYDSNTGTFIYHQVCKQVTVNCTPPCCLPTDFIITAPANCCRQFSPTFTNGCTASPGLVYWWNFGDGNTSTSANPLHCYAGSGIYTVCVTVWCSKMQKVQLCKSIIVKCILPPPPPCCIGTSKMNLNTSGQMVTATDATETSADVIITSRTWSWGDGATSTGAQAQHYYHHSGTYNIALTVEGMSGGAPFSDEVSQSITVHMAPPCTCPPANPSVFADSPLQCNAGSHSTCLKVIDYDGEAGTIYQWLQSDNAAGPFAEIPNAIGQQVWINNSNGPKYYVCRCMSELTGGYTLSEVVGINDQHFSATASTSTNAVCSGESATISVVPGSEPYYQWFPNSASSSSAVVSPTTTTLYEVFVKNAAGCGALATQQIIVNPCPTNDNLTNSPLVNNSGGAYPQSNCYNSTLEFAQVSPEGNPANVLLGGGQDVWYKVIAPNGAMRFVVSSSAMDIVLELHNASLAEVDMQNDVAGVGNETMVSTGLTPGAIYYVAVRSYDGSLGPFSICIQSLLASFCAGGSGNYELCSNFKPKWTGANSYTFNFTPTGATLGVPTSVTSATSVNLSHPALALRHGGTYNVTVDAAFNLPEGITVVVGSTVCSIVINAHASVEVKSIQRCPSTLLKGSVLQGKPFICSATGFTVEFTELDACGGAPVAMPFTATTAGASSSINLSSVTGVLGGGHWYQVRWRPVFSYGNGNYGNPQTIFVGGSAMGTYEVEENTLDTKSISSAGLIAAIYPNPNDGDMVNINVTNAISEQIYVRIYNQLGQVVYNQRFAVDQSLNTVIVFESELSSGLYFTEIVDGENMTTLKMIIEK